MSDQLEERTAPWRARSVLFGLVAGSCIPLVAAGILSTLLASVRERSREIAVRVALGASVANVVGAVMKRTAWFTGLGLMGGAAGGVAIGGVMSGLLFGVSPADPLSLLGSALVVLSTTALAALVPARLAARVAPVDALRDR